MTFFGFSPAPLHRLGSNLAGRIGPLRPATFASLPICGDFRSEKKQKSLIFATQPIFLKFTGFMCSYNPHIRLKFGEIRFINQRFISEKPRVGHFSAKFWEPLAQKLRVGFKNSCPQKWYGTPLFTCQV